MLCHPSAHLAHEPAWGGVRLARSGGTFREHAWHIPGLRMLGLDVPLFGRKPFKGFSVDRVSELYIVGDTRGCRSWTRVISRALTPCGRHVSSFCCFLPSPPPLSCCGAASSECLRSPSHVGAYAKRFTRRLNSVLRPTFASFGGPENRRTKRDADVIRDRPCPVGRTVAPPLAALATPNVYGSAASRALPLGRMILASRSRLAASRLASRRGLAPSSRPCASSLNRACGWRRPVSSCGPEERWNSR
jgi:hypothetical protein